LRPSLDQLDSESRVVQRDRRGQSGDAAADDKDPNNHSDLHVC
jgi:hypothetical protein